MIALPAVLLFESIVWQKNLTNTLWKSKVKLFVCQQDIPISKIFFLAIKHGCVHAFLSHTCAACEEWFSVKGLFFTENSLEARVSNFLFYEAVSQVNHWAK
jgi:hypothetical protein